MAHCKYCKQEMILGSPAHRCEEQSTAATEELMARRSAAACSPCEPLRRAFSREEMRNASVKWMIEQYGRPIELDSEAKDRWHERCGMLYHFIYDHFPAENATAQTPPDSGTKDHE